jgi:hypothetical protein
MFSDQNELASAWRITSSQNFWKITGPYCVSISTYWYLCKRKCRKVSLSSLCTANYNFKKSAGGNKKKKRKNKSVILKRWRRLYLHQIERPYILGTLFFQNKSYTGTWLRHRLQETFRRWADGPEVPAFQHWRFNQIRVHPLWIYFWLCWYFELEWQIWILMLNSVGRYWN